MSLYRTLSGTSGQSGIPSERQELVDSLEYLLNTKKVEWGISILRGPGVMWLEAPSP